MPTPLSNQLTDRWTTAELHDRLAAAIAQALVIEAELVDQKTYVEVLRDALKRRLEQEKNSK